MKIKPVSILAITIVGLMSAFPSNGAQMTSQIQRLLDQKEEKIKQLEKCEGKKQGWMIAGISTIGLTAVGVGVNIAQANKSNRLSGEIEQSKQELERQQERLSRIEGQISKKEQEAKAEKERAEREKAKAENSPDGEAVKVEIDHNDYKDRELDGKIGEACDDGRGTWVVGIDDTNKVCLDANGNGLQPCHCEAKKDNADKTDPAKKQGDTGPKEKKETSLQKCLRERSGDPEGTACCYLSKSVAEYVDGKCECKGDKEFSIDSNGHGKCTSVKNIDREATISGYCLNEKGEAIVGKVCWCDIYMPNYCAQNGKIKKAGICSGTAHQEVACTEFCESKKSDLIKICDDLQ